jgi:hypothetical protein
MESVDGCAAASSSAMIAVVVRVMSQATTTMIASVTSSMTSGCPAPRPKLAPVFRTSRTEIGPFPGPGWAASIRGLLTWSAASTATAIPHPASCTPTDRNAGTRTPPPGLPDLRDGPARWCAADGSGGFDRMDAQSGHSVCTAARCTPSFASPVAAPACWNSRPAPSATRPHPAAPGPAALRCAHAPRASSRAAPLGPGAR